ECHATRKIEGVSFSFVEQTGSDKYLDWTPNSRWRAVSTHIESISEAVSNPKRRKRKAVESKQTGGIVNFAERKTVCEIHPHRTFRNRQRRWQIDCPDIGRFVNIRIDFDWSCRNFRKLLRFCGLW